MKAEIARIFAAILGLVVFAAAQDISPAVLGVKPPILLAFGCMAGIPAAIIAGLFADSLGSMPFGCSAIFFLAVSIPARLLRKSAVAVAIVAAGIYQMWIALWTNGNMALGSVLGALAAAVVIVPAMKFTIYRARRIIGIDRGGAKK